MECRPVLRRHHPGVCRKGRAIVKLATLSELNAERAARRPVIVVTDVASGEQRMIKAAEFAGDPLRADLQKQLRMGKSGMIETGGKKAFFKFLWPHGRG